MLEPDAFWCFVEYGQDFLFVLKIERHGSGRLKPGTGGYKRVPQDFVDPGAKIRARPERGEPLECFGVCLLYKILGFMPVMGQPAGKVIERLEVRHGKLLERPVGKLASHAHTRVNKRRRILFP